MHPNFGDEFTPFLLPRYGFMPLLRPPQEASFFGAGSIVDMSSKDTVATLWGSGVMHSDRDSTRPAASVLALRGHLSREAMGITDSIALGDPGLLASRWIRPASAHGRIGVVLHYSHADHEFAQRLRERFGGDAHFIDPTRSLESVVRDISACNAILTTSLHGLVVADAFDIPAVWAIPEPVLPGGSFKFEDYESVVEPTALRRVSIQEITSIQRVTSAATRVNSSAVRKSQLDLASSLETLHCTNWDKSAPAMRLWRQYGRMLPRPSLGLDLL